MAAGTNAQKKHLAGLLVKKVLVHHRDKIEVWYQVPNTQRFQGFEHWNNWLANFSLKVLNRSSN